MAQALFLWLDVALVYLILMAAGGLVALAIGRP
jgi:hypothetical protein